MALRQSSEVLADGAAERIPFTSVDAALAALRAGDLDAAMVPIENSVEGGVSATLDALASGDPLVVVGEQVNHDAAWFYPAPKDAAEQIKDYVAFWKGVTVQP